MKKILVLLATALMAVACFNGKTVNISGVANKAVKELGNAQLILTDQFGNSLAPVKINQDGTFNATFDADITKGYTVSVECNGQILYENIGTVITEPGDLNVTFSTGKFYVEGGKINKRYIDAVEAYEKISKEKFDRYLEEQFTAKDDYDKALFKKEDNKKVSQEIYKKIFSKNSKNFIGLKYFELSLLDGTIDNVATFDSFYKKSKKHIVNTDDYEAKRALLVAEEETCETKPFKDISGHESAGTPVKLSDIINKSKFTILYFWDPKNSIGINITPYFNVISETFEGSISLVGIIPSDNTPEEIAKYPISGHQILVDDFSSELEKYGLTQAPYSFVLSSNGEILKRNLNGSALVEYMVENLKK